ncbi:hypothetical protein F4677DRAFT_437808 [Hypoxylon crocopeplum]|nr:hypothetical protein F4677DRAFT_437808 [Hypoxylon crocopeplum]
MDWPREKLGISETDLRNVFKYEPKETTVVRLGGPDNEIDVRPLRTDEGWEKWLDTESPSLDSRASGLVLILARRTGQHRVPTLQNGQSLVINEKTSRAMSFPIEVGGAPNAERGLVSSLSGRRSARTLPFSLNTFRSISEKFCLHGSIARIVSRSDVPVFSRVELQMGPPEGPTYPAYVYNCRSTNAWDMDLALTVTHFPHLGLTYAVLFGCPIFVEKDIIKRLRCSSEAASYPLLLPGIFAELERTRHIKIVEDYMDDIEEKIFELDCTPPVEQQMHGPDGESRNRDKRSQWLDATYLRNGLITWNQQLSKMARHTEELKDTLYTPGAGQDSEIRSSAGSYTSSVRELKTHGCERSDIRGEEDRERSEADDRGGDDESRRHEMRKIGDKINDRLLAIIEEYEEKIRECTMRIDGMAMATQWSHGETNVEIALATGRDSRYMRSIAIVTMVFLPGTFLASVFSMQFFNWFVDESGSTIVSRYIWIYVLVTVVATLLTLGSWYYFVFWRHRQRKEVSDDERPLVS